MRQKIALLFLVCFGAVALVLGTRTVAQSGLQVTYGNSGIQKLSYAGVTLEDLDQFPSDAFHIWHMKITDLQGNVLSNGQYGWGENNNGRNWNGGSHKWTYPFDWGSITVQFVQTGDTLNMNVTEKNSSGSGIVLQGASIFPMVLHFPQLPVGFNNPGYAQLGFNTTAPGVTLADFGRGEVASVVPDASKPLYSGFQPASPANAYYPIISSTSIDGMASFQPHFDRPVQPGQTDTFTVSLRFAPSGKAPATLATDAYQSWAQTWPAQLKWTDRRIIGSIYLASSPDSKDVTKPGGFPNNPRRYFNESDASRFDVRSPAGLASFQNRILQQAVSNVQNLQRLNAQGGITWDIEGEEYPQETSYACSPDQIGQIAPEMESVIVNAQSPYNGMKLVDAYFKTMKDAGLRVGVCVRPQHFTKNSDGTASQVYLSNSAVASELIRKMRYAHDRWGATLFYADSTVESNGATLDASILQQAAAALPDSLIIPEETTPKHYAYTAAFQTFLFHTDLGTDSTIYSYYPSAFSAILVNDVDAAKLAQYRSQLTDSVRHGDILIVHGDYWQTNNDTVLQMYRDAGVAMTGQGNTASNSGEASPTGTSTGTATSSAGSDTQSSTAPSTAATTSSGGDANSISAATTEASAATSGSGSSVATSSSSSGSTASTGASTAVPGNSTSTTSVTTPAQPSTPVASTYQLGIVSPSSSQTISGTIQVSAEINVPLDAAGSYLMADGLEIGTRRVTTGPFSYPLDTTQLANGTHILQLWAHDLANDTLLSGTVTVTVNNSEGQQATSASSSSNCTSSSSPTTSITSSSIPVTSTSQADSSTTSQPTSSSTSGGTSAAQAAAAGGYPIALTYPLTGQGISGVVSVVGSISQGLDAAGSYLMVDGVEVGWKRVGTPPFVYELDTQGLSAGQHILQIWAHDIANDTLLSNPAVVTITHL